MFFSHACASQGETGNVRRNVETTGGGETKGGGGAPFPWAVLPGPPHRARAEGLPHPTPDTFPQPGRPPLASSRHRPALHFQERKRKLTKNSLTLTTKQTSQVRQGRLQTSKEYSWAPNGARRGPRECCRQSPAVHAPMVSSPPHFQTPTRPVPPPPPLLSTTVDGGEVTPPSSPPPPPPPRGIGASVRHVDFRFPARKTPLALSSPLSCLPPISPTGINTILMSTTRLLTFFVFLFSFKGRLSEFIAPRRVWIFGKADEAGGQDPNVFFFFLFFFFRLSQGMHRKWVC